MGAWPTYLLYAGFSACGGLFIYFFLPETAGLKLEAIEALFHAPIRPEAGGAGASAKPMRLAEEPREEAAGREMCAMR